MEGAVGGATGTEDHRSGEDHIIAMSYDPFCM